MSDETTSGIGYCRWYPHPERPTLKCSQLFMLPNEQKQTTDEQSNPATCSDSTRSSGRS